MASDKKFPSSEITRLDREIEKNIARAVSGEPEASRRVGDLAARRVELTSPPAFKRIHQMMASKKITA